MIDRLADWLILVATFALIVMMVFFSIWMLKDMNREPCRYHLDASADSQSWTCR